MFKICPPGHICLTLFDLHCMADQLQIPHLGNGIFQFTYWCMVFFIPNEILILVHIHNLYCIHIHVKYIIELQHVSKQSHMQIGLNISLKYMRKQNLKFHLLMVWPPSVCFFLNLLNFPFFGTISPMQPWSPHHEGPTKTGVASENHRYIVTSPEMQQVIESPIFNHWHMPTVDAQT